MTEEAIEAAKLAFMKECIVFMTLGECEDCEIAWKQVPAAIAAYNDAWSPCPSNPVTPIGERLTALLDDDQWNNIEPMLIDAHNEIDALRAQLADCRAVLRAREHADLCPATRCHCGGIESAWWHDKDHPHFAHKYHPDKCSDACGYARVMGEG